MSTYFVTAIGTDIGKTFCSAALLYGARKAGIDARGYKPVACGSENPSAGDVAELAEASGALEPSPFWYKAALSPHMAAAHEGKTLDTTALTRWCKERMGKDGLTLIEGVGGLLVPLTIDYTVRHWISDLRLPVVLVTSNYLGALNHTLLTLEVLRYSWLSVSAIIITECAHGVSLAETEATVKHYAKDAPLIVTQPRVGSWKEAKEIQALAPKLAGNG